MKEETKNSPEDHFEEIEDVFRPSELSVDREKEENLKEKNIFPAQEIPIQEAVKEEAQKTLEEPKPEEK